MLREWTTIIIVLLIITVVLDGIRRMRHHRRSALRMSLSMHQGTRKEDLKEYGSELPGGGARVATVRNESDARKFHEQLRQAKQEQIQRTGRPYKIPEQVSLNLDDQVPTLMEVDGDEQQSLQEPQQLSQQPSQQEPQQKRQQAREKPKARPQKPAAEKPAASRQDPLFDELTFGDDHRVEPSFGDSQPARLDDEQPAEQSAADQPEQEVWEIPEQKEHQITAELESAVTAPEFLPEADDEVQEQGIVQEPESPAAAEPSYREPVDESPVYEEPAVEQPEPEQPRYIEPEEVLVINVMAPRGSYFSGQGLLQTLLEQGMRYGAMNIFHHHEQPNGDGGILYSMANIVKPGTFDLNAMADFVTPGVSLFMTLPLESDAKAAFANMVDTAKALQQHLGGELKDENRSVLTAQTIEHYRNRIEEFQRKQLSRAPA